MKSSGISTLVPGLMVAPVTPHSLTHTRLNLHSTHTHTHTHTHNMAHSYSFVQPSKLSCPDIIIAQLVKW